MIDCCFGRLSEFGQREVPAFLSNHHGGLVPLDTDSSSKILFPCILSPSDSFKLPKLNILPHSYFAPPNSCVYLQAIVASPVEISEPHKDRNPVTSLLTTIVSMI